MPKAKYWRRFALSSSIRNPQAGYRDLPTFLSPPERSIQSFKRGVPVFPNKAFDGVQRTQSSYKRHVAPKPPPVIKTDYTEADFHEMKCQFKFTLRGDFPHRGVPFEAELFKVANDLHLVGYMRVRQFFSHGHLQGDAYSLSYFRKWLDERHNKEGTIQFVRFMEHSSGLPEYTFQGLLALKDWRYQRTKEAHRGRREDDSNLRRFRLRAEQARSAHERLIDKHCVQNY